ncbi:mucoidy inhibitor MuiA family protein, partial [candidate division TA06 bacterium]|nr:mucoidy inhibitor MuiA family protein [candidate division TA06 bacterium]
MKKVVIFSLLWIVPQLANATIQNRLSPLSQITSVTVYEDRAMVTRTAQITLEPKEYQVVFQDLPEKIFEESVRTSGKGQARVTITGLEVKKTFLEKSGEARVRDLENQIQTLEDKKRGIQDLIKSRKSQQNFLSSIQVLSGDQISKELSTKRPNVVEYQQLLDFFYEGMAFANQEIQKLEIQQRELTSKLNLLQRELQQIRSTRALSRNSVIVSLEALRGGTFELDISYVVSGAGWRPSYDARVVGNPHKVELRYYGEVWQKTGEDWPEAKITLSTARPAIRGRVPDLNLWALNFFPSHRYAAKMKESRQSSIQDDFNGKSAGDATAPEEKIRNIARIEMAQVRASGTSVLFEIDERKEVSSDGSRQKFTIAIDQFKPDMQYEAVPKHSPYAFLNSTVKNEADY